MIAMTEAGQKSQGASAKLGQAFIMAREGYGWEDIRVRLKLTAATARMIVFGRKR